MSEDSSAESADPRDEKALLRTYRPLRDVGEAGAGPTPIPVPAGAICEKCGSDLVSMMPYFSAGSGLAFRPTASDICCKRCGHIGPADFT